MGMRAPVAVVRIKNLSFGDGILSVTETINGKDQVSTCKTDRAYLETGALICDVKGGKILEFEEEGEIQ